ncbi:MAG: amidohydrolase family protein [Rubrivivax sp.]|nr:amidohydrolase family protein [Rubrivivax sp.]
MPVDDRRGRRLLSRPHVAPGASGPRACAACRHRGGVLRRDRRGGRHDGGVGVRAQPGGTTRTVRTAAENDAQRPAGRGAEPASWALRRGGRHRRQRDVHDPHAEIDRCVSALGLRAICIEPGRAPGCGLDDRALYPIYEQCQSLGVTVIAQTSGALGGTYVDDANPHHVERVAEDFRDLRIVCGHGCYPYVREAIVMASRRDNVWLSPDICFFHLGHEDWVKAINANLMGFAERFLFGSSYPLTAIAPYVENFLRVAWKSDVLERILYRNALRALGVEDDPVFAALYPPPAHTD